MASAAMSPPPPPIKIQKQEASLAAAGDRLRTVRRQFPHQQSIKEVIIGLDFKSDRIPAGVISKFAEKYGDQIRAQAAERKAKQVIADKKSAELAAARLRWQKQQEDAAKEAARKEKDRIVREKRSAPVLVVAKKLSKINPTSGYDPRSHISKIQDKPSPTKLNKVLGQEVLVRKQSGPTSFKIPKKSDRHFAITLPTCPSHQDTELNCNIYDPLSELLGPAVKDESVKTKQKQNINNSFDQEDIPNSPVKQQHVKDRPLDKGAVIVGGRDDVCRSITFEAEPEAEYHVSIPDVPEDEFNDPVLDAVEHMIEEKIHQSSPKKKTPDSSFFVRKFDAFGRALPQSAAANDVAQNKDTELFGNSSQPADPRALSPSPPPSPSEDADTAMASDPESEDSEGAGDDSIDDGPKDKSVSMSFGAVDDDELDFGGDDDDEEDNEDDDDDGNFKRKRGSGSSKNQPKRNAPAAPKSSDRSSTIGLLGLVDKDIRSNPSSLPSFSASKSLLPSSSLTSSCRVSVGPPPPPGRRHVMHEDSVEPEVDAELKAKRAARFTSSKEIIHSKVAKTLIRSADPPAAAAPPLLATPAPAPAPRIPKGITTKQALLKDARSFSPEPDVEPDIVPVIRPKNRTRVQIVNPSVLLDSIDDAADLFAPPVKVPAAEPVAPPQPSPPPPALLPAAPANTPLQSSVTTVARADPRLSAVRVDPRIAAHPDIRPNAVPDPQEAYSLKPSLPPALPLPPVPKTPESIAPAIDEISFLTSFLPESVEESLFNEYSVSKNDYVLIYTEPAKLYKTRHDDQPPADIPFSLLPGDVVLDPRLMDAQVDENTEDEDESVPLFGQQIISKECPPKLLPLSEAKGDHRLSLSKAIEVLDALREDTAPPEAAPDAPKRDANPFKMPIGPAPRRKSKESADVAEPQRRREERMPKRQFRLTSGRANRPGGSHQSVTETRIDIKRPAALMQKGSDSMRAEAAALINEIHEIRKHLKPKKTMTERMREAAEKEASGKVDEKSVVTAPSLITSQGIIVNGKMCREIRCNGPVNGSPGKIRFLMQRRKKRKKIEMQTTVIAAVVTNGHEEEKKDCEGPTSVLSIRRS